MEKFVIEGGTPLKGEVNLCGAKNSGFKLLIASLYCDSFSTIHNFSKIGDVYSTAEIIRDLGGQVIFGDNHILKVSAEGMRMQVFSKKSGRLSRASTYFVGPLLYRFGRAVLPIPGGCMIGKRPLDRHLEGIKALGASIKNTGEYYEIKATKLKGTRYRFAKNTHGGTDIMIIAACIADGKTILENAAQEPEIDDLINFLNQLGAKITRVGPRIIEIEGVNNFKPSNFTVMPDRNEAVTFACCALATRGDIFVHKANPDVLTAFLEALKNIGGGFGIEENGIRFFYKGKLKCINITTRPYPGFMTDWMSLWTILMTQAEGESMVHETIFENRFAFVSEIKKMKAKIDLFNPVIDNPEKVYNFNILDDKPEYFHAAKITGPSSLKATKQEITDVRAGASMILASLIASGKSELTNIEHVDRGYENLDERLRSLGAKIKRINV